MQSWPQTIAYTAIASIHVKKESEWPDYMEYSILYNYTLKLMDDATDVAGDSLGTSHL